MLVPPVMCALNAVKKKCRILEVKKDVSAAWLPWATEAPGNLETGSTTLKRVPAEAHSVATAKVQIFPLSFCFFRYWLLYLRAAPYHPWYSAGRKTRAHGRARLGWWEMSRSKLWLCFHYVQRVFSLYLDIPFRRSNPVAIPSSKINRFLCIYGKGVE